MRVYQFGAFRALENGTTLHGIQLSGSRANEPTTYYSPTSGIGSAIRRLHGAINKPLNVGVIGLGVGTLTAYNEVGAIVFYEIDTRVAHIAKKYFSFLSRKNVDIRLGDGLSTLANELAEGRSGAFDILVVDAFHDGSIPRHLLSNDALKIYQRHLRSGASIIAIHTSGSINDAGQEVFHTASNLDMPGIIIHDNSHAFGMNSSQWVLLSRGNDVINITTNSCGRACVSKSSEQS